MESCAEFLEELLDNLNSAINTLEDLEIEQAELVVVHELAVQLKEEVENVLHE